MNIQDSITVNYSDVVCKAAKFSWWNLTLPKSKVLKVLKVTVGIPLYLVLVAAGIAIAAVVALRHIPLLPWGEMKPLGFRMIGKYLAATMRECFSIFCAV